jgi:succinyl-CoA synthetase beta subunit
VERLRENRSQPGLAEALLADYGVPQPPSRWVSSRSDALAAAAELGGSVVLKTAAGIVHKTDVDGVRLDLSDQDAVGEAYDDLAARLGPRVQVQAQLSPGVELSAGIVKDPVFGWLVVVGVGGSLVELIAERAVALAPVDPRTATTLLAGTRVGELLAGVRGRTPVGEETEAVVAQTISALSAVAHELGDHLRALEVNPLLVSPGCVAALDAVLE